MRKSTQMLLLALCGVTAFCGPASAVVPAVDDKGVPAITTCPATLNAPRVEHFDKIVFVITGPLTAAVAADQIALNNLLRNVELDIKVRDNPNRIANLRHKVLSFLGASITSASGNFAYINIRDVEYAAIVCPKSP